MQAQPGERWYRDEKLNLKRLPYREQKRYEREKTNLTRGGRHAAKLGELYACALVVDVALRHDFFVYELRKVFI